MKQNDILFLAISSFVVIAAWIGFGLYHTWITSTISQSLLMQTTPIIPSFDTATIDTLGSRLQVTPQYQLPSVGIASAAGSLTTPFTIQGQ